MPRRHRTAAGRSTEDLGASRFVLGALVGLLALLAWDVMNPYDDRDAHTLRSRERDPESESDEYRGRF